MKRQALADDLVSVRLQNEALRAEMEVLAMFFSDMLMKKYSGLVLSYISALSVDQKTSCFGERMENKFQI